MTHKRTTTEAHQSRSDPGDARTPATRGDMRQRAPQRRSERLMGALLAFAAHPVSVLWVLAGVAVAGGIIEWVFFDRSPWEGFGAAGVIAGLVQIVARVKGVSAWPWQRPDPDE